MGAVSSRLKKLMNNKAADHDHRYRAVIEYLIRVGFPIYSAEVFDEAGKLTAYLHFAVKYYFIPEAIELIQLGANPRGKNAKGRSTFQYAVVNKRHVRQMEEIIPNGIQYRKMKFYGLSSLRFATATRDRSRIKELAATQDNFDSDNLRLAKMLLNAGADVNNKDVNDCSPIQCAIYTGDLELVKIIIDAGADINNQNRIGATALHDAVLCCNEEMVMLLLSRGANVAAVTLEFGDSALHWASMLNIGNSHDGIIKKLLEFGSDLYKSNLVDWTSFNYIVHCCDVNLVRLCIDEYKADLKKVDPDGNNALVFAVHNLDKNVMDLVLESGVEIEPETNYGNSPLHIACEMSMLENVQRLISRGANVNAENKNGVKPLQKCIFMPHTAKVSRNLPFALQRATFAEERRKVIILLLKCGADVNQKMVRVIRDSEKQISLFELIIDFEEIDLLNMIIAYVDEVEARSNVQLLDNYNLAVIDEVPVIKSHYQTCRAELAAMRTTNIGDTTITYFSVLTEPLGVVARYTRNKEFVKTFEAGDYKTAYDIYASTLKEKFDAAFLRQKMFEKVSAVLSATLQFADPTNVIFEIIFKYLRESDVKFLIDDGTFFEDSKL